MNNPFDYTPDKLCNRAFYELIEYIDSLKLSDDPVDINFIRELKAGKMIGVMIAIDKAGEQHSLWAFSGQVGNAGFYHPRFVEPVFDYLQPDGHFKTHEADISRQNTLIQQFENETLAQLTTLHERTRRSLQNRIDEFKSECRRSKANRDALRKQGNTNPALIDELTRQSQFEKAELHRMKVKMAQSLEPYAARLEAARTELLAMKLKRRNCSEALQQWLFSNFMLLNAEGECKSVSEIFAATPMKIPPSGSGECCAPKLLQAAYRRGWKPVAMAEYWYGEPKQGELRVHGQHYPACRGKCRPLLQWMLRGLDITPPLDSAMIPTPTHQPVIIFENQWFCVVDKPAGMLSVPGKSEEISVQQWLMDKYGPHRKIRMAHRLDQDTSGLIIATFGNSPYIIMQELFATRKVDKTYLADLNGDYLSLGVPQKGEISLPLAPDWLDRPRQKVDFDNGKPAITSYRFNSVGRATSRITFKPLTGRTHQLRVHAASSLGLNMPIVGDRIYGIRSRRLHLHADRLEFTFPIDGQHYCFESPAPF